MVTPQDFIHRLKSQNYILNKQYHVKVLLKRFYLNNHSIVTLQDFAHRLKRQNHQCQKGGKLLLRDHDAKGTFGISFTSSLMLYFFQRVGGAALSARIPSAVSHQTRPRTGPRRSGSAIPGRKIGRHGVEVAILPPHSQHPRVFSLVSFALRSCPPYIS